jgi:hypothetical protein
LLALQFFDARRKFDAQQVRKGKVDFGKAVGVRAVNGRLQHVNWGLLHLNHRFSRQSLC